ERAALDSTRPDADDWEVGVGVQPPATPAGDAAPAADGADGPPPTRGQRALPVVVEWLIVLVCALGLALLLKAFLVEVFVIPSGSMEPTLMVDNRVVVYKLGYRLHDVNRGDVVVFDNPAQSADVDDLIKRVVALGGETFELRDGRVYIDGTRLEEPYLEPGESTFPKAPIRGCLNEADSARCEVPEGKVIMLGDSREDSRDSRFFGPVDVDDIVGRAFMKIWPPTDMGGL
ncbi:MAG: signal peptidase I, partial [Acidimicrobiaceae bacterium]|nr:signal peptidase I [Acidimicrobiaceae bacterium]